MFSHTTRICVYLYDVCLFLSFVFHISKFCVAISVCLLVHIFCIHEVSLSMWFGSSFSFPAVVTQRMMAALVLGCSRHFRQRLSRQDDALLKLVRHYRSQVSCCNNCNIVDCAQDLGVPDANVHWNYRSVDITWQTGSCNHIHLDLLLL